MIGMFCRFCSDIYTNLSKFLHHLQWMHSDVLKFTKAHNVYSMEELLSSSDTQNDVHLQANSSSRSSSDSGMPADKADATDSSNSGISYTMESDAIASIVMNKNILSALATYEVDYQETKASKKTNSPKNVLQWQAEADNCLPVADQAKDVIAEVEAMLFNSELRAEESSAPKKPKLPSENFSDHKLQLQQTSDFQFIKPQLSVDLIEKPIKPIEEHKSKLGRPQTETKSKTQKPEKPKFICDYKSYAIARSVRKREQQQRLQIIKKRIFSSINGDFRRINRVPFKPANDVNIIKDHLLVKAKNLAKQKESLTKDQLAQIDHKKQLSSTKLNLQLETKSTHPVCHAKLKFDSENCSCPNENHLEKLTKNLADTKSQKTMPNRRPSYSEPSVSSSQLQVKTTDQCKVDTTENEKTRCKNAEQNTSNRVSLNFDLSESAVEFLQSELQTSLVNADSLLELAVPIDAQCNSNASETLPKAIPSVQPQEQKQLNTQPDQETLEIKINSVDKDLRNDVTLLKVVGLAIIKYADFEEVKPIEFIDTIRGKAAKFANILRQYTTVWNPKRSNTQFTPKILMELLRLTEETNAEFKFNLDVSEMKRILNLINSWHAQQIDLRFFKKVTLSSAVDYYLQLFAFLPKINSCVYYCEWCDESSSNKTRYEKHRITHLSRYACPQCKRGFKKQGFLFNHLRTMHGLNH
ncbi:hypothetical protein AWZ03_008261 [Drosophila navojoa]|uniref:C2H2-type domain-containing protein n=1 Tax=Drosophila navojoa TaxID=7232 RepID=A0A484BAF9_DRONA|nr:hypothetical protein AWZ03_008261 [Drosophila navojoa]